MAALIFEVFRNVGRWASHYFGPTFKPFWTYIAEALRPKIKWILRRTTGLTELQRVCYGENAGAPRNLAVELSMVKSRKSGMKKLIQFLNRAAEEGRFSGSEGHSAIISNSVQAVYQIKEIRPEVHPKFGKIFGTCVSHIWGYRDLLHILEKLRTMQYDSASPEHEKKLLDLWSLLMPNQMLRSRVTDQWKEVGFQGDDPKTDFRGMGILGLENLLYFVKEYPAAALHVLSHSNHPKYGYSFAIVGINLTSTALTLWKTGAAKTHFYNYCHHHNIQRPEIYLFHQFYCYLFFEFDRFWLAEKPATIMEFSRIHNLFEKNIRAKLANPSVLLKLDFFIDTL
nr:EOG090X0AMT [Eulimnadia texana]